LWPFGIFCGHLVYFIVIWYILWPFGIFYCHLEYIFRIGMLHQEKSGNPACNLDRNSPVSHPIYLCKNLKRKQVHRMSLTWVCNLGRNYPISQPIHFETVGCLNIHAIT
jgi:hypothetical protein